MDNSRPLVPNFLKKIDRSLLLKSPSVWSTRTHLVLFFGLLFAAILTVFCVIVFRDGRQNNNMEILLGFTALISTVGFIFWLIYLLRFNVFKRYGNWVKGDGIRTFALFFVNILLMVTIPFIPLVTESFMANNQFSDAELISDINEMNINANRLQYDRLPKFWESDTLLGVTPKIKIDEITKDTTWLSITPNDENFRPNTTYIPIDEIDDRLLQQDSIVKINDSTFVTYECPRYAYVHSYNYNSNSEEGIMDNVNIYNAAIKNYQKPNRVALLKRMEAFKTKYNSNDSYYENNLTATDKEETFEEYIKRIYSLQEINNIVDRIFLKKHEWKREYLAYLHVIFWLTLITTLLLFTFRHTTIKTFFLTALTGVVLAILSGLFIAFTNGRDITFYMLMICYFILFTFISFTIKKTRTLLHGISLNFFFFTLPIIPLIIASFYLELNYKNYYDRYHHYFNKTPYYIGAEIIGFILLLILIEPLFKKLYRAWYAAPEE
jgi:hypothetical protein